MIFDSHAHYDSDAFDEDREILLERLHDVDGVCAIVNPAENLESSLRCIALAEKYDFVYAAVGVHPCYAETWQEGDAEQYRDMLKHPKAVAVGEIGLDYYHSVEFKTEQHEAFCAMLELARDERKPVIIHDRDAHGDMYKILREYKPNGVMHCFSGSVELAREALSYGLYIGLGGAVTFKNAVSPVEVAKYVPLDRLVLETDAPYMTPMPCRPKKGRPRCDSSMIRATAEKIAEVRGMDVEELLHATADNAARLYNLSENISIR
ncbi:MAG: TatD family hydrolase [Firmicutes bacterium]|nr:TatD family hydrolase [Bacillota bacterium]